MVNDLLYVDIHTVLIFGIFIALKCSRPSQETIQFRS